MSSLVLTTSVKNMELNRLLFGGNVDPLAEIKSIHARGKEGSTARADSSGDDWSTRAGNGATRPRATGGGTFFSFSNSAWHWLSSKRRNVAGLRAPPSIASTNLGCERRDSVFKK